ncbi:hypothetical protein HMF8227_00099 [Saliniradius amylolyticus]|uniref:TIGR02444 family protein n=1 Tax=Saliniradius amylolyticus TaxID=2183582 RepID=A0A2S2E0R6_9ALTE|nr:TIGR02444 family protein [Saliniradius amylolyticus]AWL10607.1 hypothetical protein HMF8227_00099 [Saliniradius amylolyticus]
MNTNWQVDDFWQVSLDWYQQGQRHFLALQDKYGLNVNLALLSLYTAKHGYVLTEQNYHQLVEALEGTEKILSPLRQLRRKTKAMDSGAYKDMKAAELALERRQQSALLVMLKHLEVERGDGHSNLANYCQSQGVSAPKQLESLLALI